MKTCVIFCAGGFDGLIEPIAPDDYILAADGGYAHLKTLGLQADGVLGDFDSLGYTPSDAEIFPVEKDDTDAMLAVRKGLELGFRRFLLYGSLDGPRLDHTVANFQTLMYLATHGAMGYLVGKDYIVTVLRAGRLKFSRQARGILSVFCLGADAEAVTLKGLQYPLEKGRLTADFPLGVSNHFLGEEASVEVGKGTLLVMWDRANGLPAEVELC